MDNVRQKSKVICLVGIDGTGKTAHAYKIFSDLETEGRKCKYVWFGASYFLSYPFMALCRILGLTEIHHLPNKVICYEHQYHGNKPIALIWPWIRFLDLAIFVMFQVYVPLWRGFIVVCDRFIDDALVEVMVDVVDVRLHEKLVGRLMLKLKPKSSIVFLLDVDEKVAFRRKLDLSNLTYLAHRRRNYYLIANDLRIPIINAEGPFSLVHKEIIKQLEG